MPPKQPTTNIEDSVREVVTKLTTGDDTLAAIGAAHMRLLCTKGEDVIRKQGSAGTKDYLRAHRSMFDEEMASALVAGGAATALLSLLQMKHSTALGLLEAEAPAVSGTDESEVSTPGTAKKSASKQLWLVIDTAVSALSVLCQDVACAALVMQESALKLLVSLISTVTETTMESAVSAMICLMCLASSHENRVAIANAGAIPPLVQALEFGPEEAITTVAVEALANLAFADENKAIVQQKGGIQATVRLLSAPPETPCVELAIQALTILSFQSPTNQSEIRERGAIPQLITIMSMHSKAKLASTIMAAVEALRVLAQGESNRACIREEGAFPQLVSLLQACRTPSPLDPVKTLEALGVLCANNDLNKAAFRDANGVPVLMELLSGYGPITERATRLVVTLSLSPAFHATIRDAGGIQKLTALLQQRVKTYNITALAAKALANLAVTDSTRTAIRLTGTVPALVWLLTDMPTKEVFTAVEDTLRRMEVTDLERNAILQTLRYVENVQAAKTAQEEDERSKKEAEIEEKRKIAEQKPLVRYSVEDLSSLLEAMGMQNVHKIESWGLNGGDLLWITDDVLNRNPEDLRLHPLERLKIGKVQEANLAFNAVTRRPGSGVATTEELASYFGARGVVDPELSNMVETLTESAKTPGMLTFREFCLMYDWLKWTLAAMGIQTVTKSAHSSPVVGV